MPQIITV